MSRSLVVGRRLFFCILRQRLTHRGRFRSLKLSVSWPLFSERKSCRNSFLADTVISISFQTLQKGRAHASISTSRKLLIYHACIVSTLTYGLHTAWLITAERRRLDGFHARCIRKIIGVLPSYYSRISNRAILERARATPLSSILMRRQLQFLAHIAYRTHGDALRDAVFRPGTLHPREFEGARARGRPRQTWTSGVLPEALEAAGGSQEHLSFLLQDTPGCRRAWKNAISKHCNKAAEGSK